MHARYERIIAAPSLPGPAYGHAPLRGGERNVGAAAEHVVATAKVLARSLGRDTGEKIG